jgi:uncharacterized membrane protein
MDLARIWRHLVHSPRALGRAFPEASLARIESAVKSAETDHSGEIRIALEGDMDFMALVRGQTPRERAIEVFSELRVWDTARNNGVLVYVLLADRDVEIVADRGFTPRVEQAEWERVCRTIESEFRAGRWEDGLMKGIDAVSGIVAASFPYEVGDRAELANRPAVL